MFSIFGLLILGGIAYGVVAAVRASTGDASGPDSRPFDSAEATKSFGIHVALFAAMIAITVGVLDFVQEMVTPGRIAGTNSDLARGLSLVIVGVPVFFLLLRLIQGRYRERAAAGDERPHRGWTVYLIVALTTTLIATLGSVAQILWDAFDDYDDRGVEATVVAQLCVWFLAWALHWFALRPRFRVIGDAHLAIGSLIGLWWVVFGFGGVFGGILQRAYSALVDDTLSDSISLWQWFWLGIVGVAVWAWHWFANFNATGSVEGDRRGSPLWYFTVVIGAILPALLACLYAAGGAIIGLLIWFFGTHDESAADFFEPSTWVLTVFFVGFVTWGYHRYEFGRNGPQVRNEAVRMHDYIILAIALFGVVVAITAIIGLLAQVLLAPTAFAGGFDTRNFLLIAVPALLICVGVWWYFWSGVERARHQSPIAESDSTWRKLYLTVGFGVGGLILSVSLVWMLFSFLQDLLDDDLGRPTFDDLTWPFAWSVAVIGAVWYHLDIWRVDRETLSAHTLTIDASPAPAIGATAAGVASPTGGPSAPPPVGVTRVGSPPPPGSTERLSGPAVFPDSPPVATNGPVIAPTPVSPTPVSPIPVAPVPIVSTPTGAAEVAAVDNGLALRLATADDSGEIFSLQRAAFVDEAIAYGTIEVPSLQETIEELRARLVQSATVVAVDQGRIVGSVSVRRYREGGPDIERLMVAPDRRRDGIASMLLDGVEASLRDQGESSVQLIVGEIVTGNRELYEGRGFDFVSRAQAPGGPSLLTLRKQL